MLFVAVTHGAAKRQGQVVLRQVMGVFFALTQQVADIEHLQQPPDSLAQEPAARVQGSAMHGHEVQVQRLPCQSAGAPSSTSQLCRCR